MHLKRSDIFLNSRDYESLLMKEYYTNSCQNLRQPVFEKLMLSCGYRHIIETSYLSVSIFWYFSFHYLFILFDKKSEHSHVKVFRLYKNVKTKTKKDGRRARLETFLVHTNQSPLCYHSDVTL